MRSKDGQVQSHAAIIIAAVVLVAAAGGTFAYFHYTTPQLSPDTVLANTWNAMQNAKTFSYAANVTSTIDISALDSPVSSVSFNATASGTDDNSDPSNLAESATVNISGNAGTSTFSGGADFIALNKIYYVKLDSLALGTPGGANPFTSMAMFFEGQWFKIDPAALAQTFLKAQVSQLQNEMQPTPEKIAQIKSLVSQYNIFSVSETLPNEIISGHDTYHYKLAINKDNLKNYIVAVYGVLYGTSTIPGATGANGTVPSAASIASSSQQLIDAITFNDVEIWIGTNDFYVYKTVGDITIAPPGSGSINLQLAYLTNNFNVPVTITAPAGAKDVNAILSGLVGGMTNMPAVPSMPLSPKKVVPR